MLNAVIEIALGLILLFTILSLLCSKINELVATALHLRARNLRKAIRHLVGPVYAAKVYDHPFITALYRGDSEKVQGFGRLIRWLFRSPGPSYLPADKFVIALLDSTCHTAVTADPPLPPDPSDRLQYALTRGADIPPALMARMLTPEDVQHQIEAEIATVTDDHLRRSLTTLWRAASGSVVTFRAGVEEWFNHTMDRATGWYKRVAQIMALGLGFTMAVALNVDTIHVTERLWSDGPLRTAVVEQIKKVPLPTTTVPAATTTTVAGPTPPVPPPPTTTPPAPPTTVAPGVADDVVGIAQGLSQINALQLPLGWDKGQRPDNYRLAVVGWIITAIALSLGAPFWFDLLNKVTALRGGGTQETTPTQDPKKAAK